MDRQKENRRLLEDMVAIPSISGTERQLAEFLKEYLGNMNVDSSLTHLTETSSNLTARIRFGDSPQTIMLGGHLDTVAPVQGWKTDPFQVVYEGDRAFGLGTCDMKGGLAAQITVLHQMLQEGTKFQGTVLLAAVADEEAFSAGANRFAEEGPEADLAILGEPHFDHVVTAANGKGLVTFCVTGTGGHAARPETGVNAVNSMAILLEKLEEYYRENYENGKCGAYCPLRVWSDYPGYSLNIPDCCRALVNKQLMIGENLEELIEKAEEIFRENQIPGRLEAVREALWYPSYALDTQQREVKAFLEALKNQGHCFYEKQNESVSDGNLFVCKCKIPTVLFGPQGANLHSAGEYVVLSSLEKYRNYLLEYFQRLGERKRE